MGIALEGRREFSPVSPSNGIPNRIYVRTGHFPGDAVKLPFGPALALPEMVIGIARSLLRLNT